MTLYEAGKDAMEKEFRNLLARHGRPVPPGSLLDVLALEHGSNFNYVITATTIVAIVVVNDSVCAAVVMGTVHTQLCWG